MYAEGSPKEYVACPHYGDGKAHFAGRIFSFGESILHLRNNLRYDNWDDLNCHLDEIEQVRKDYGISHIINYRQMRHSLVRMPNS